MGISDLDSKIRRRRLHPGVPHHVPFVGNPDASAGNDPGPIFGLSADQTIQESFACFNRGRFRHFA